MHCAGGPNYIIDVREYKKYIVMKDLTTLLMLAITKMHCDEGLNYIIDVSKNKNLSVMGDKTILLMLSKTKMFSMMRD